MVSDLNMSHGKMSDFVLFPLFGFTLVIKVINFDFESHWKILIIFDKKRHGVKFEYVPWKMSDFVSFLLFLSTLIVKLRYFDFKSQWNVLIFFDKERYGVRFEYASWKNVWFCFISIIWFHFNHKTEKFRF